MTTQTLGAGTSTRFAGACGISAALLLVVAPMTGMPAGVVLWTGGLLLLLPFLAGLAALLAGDAGPWSWLAPLIPVAGSIAVGLYMVIAGVGHVANNVSKASPVHEPLHAVESALFALTLLPLGLAVAATAAVMLRHHVRPRWLGYATAVVAIILLGNRMVLGTEQVPGFLAFVLWTFVSGFALVGRRRTAHAGHLTAPTAATPVS